MFSYSARLHIYTKIRPSDLCAVNSPPLYFLSYYDKYYICSLCSVWVLDIRCSLTPVAISYSELFPHVQESPTRLRGNLHAQTKPSCSIPSVCIYYPLPQLLVIRVYVYPKQLDRRTCAECIIFVKHTHTHVLQRIHGTKGVIYTYIVEFLPRQISCDAGLCPMQAKLVVVIVSNNVHDYVFAKNHFTLLLQQKRN